MSASGQPKKPPGPPLTAPPRGPPPVVNDGSGTIRGVGEMRRPPGPPPGAPPLSALKPPPLAPPPRSLLQSSQRPPIENIKAIDTPIGDSLRLGPPGINAKPLTVSSAGRGPPPPRGLLPDFNSTDDSTSDIAIRKDAAPRINITGERKLGAISAFDAPDNSQEPSEKKSKASSVNINEDGRQVGPPPRGPPPRPTFDQNSPSNAVGGQRIPRPLPPRPQAPGIPEGQPFPPDQRPPKEPGLTSIPPPIRPAPNRNRAPPRGEPDVIIVPTPSAPTSDAPYQRGKKDKVEEYEYVKRRERDMPEFESSSDEEVEKADFKRRAVKQPAGLPKHKIPEPKPVINEDDFEVAPALPFRQTTATAASISINDDTKIRPASMQTSTMTSASVSASASMSNKQKQSEEKSAPVVTIPPTQPLQFIQPKKIVKDDDKSIAMTFATQPAALSAAVSVAETFDTSSFVHKTDINEKRRQDLQLATTQQMEQSDDILPAIMNTEDLITSSFVPPPPSAYDDVLDDSAFARSLPRGRLSIKCIEGTGIRRKNDNNTFARTDPFIKFRLGAADKHPWKFTETRRKQTDNPQFEDEIVFFNILDPRKFVFREDLQLIIEVWNKSTLKDEIIGSVTMSIVRFLKNPFFSFEENIPLSAGTRKLPMKIKLEFVFEEARSGIFSFTLFEARGLQNVDKMGQQSPYVQLSLGEHYNKKSQTIKNGGVNPYFTEEEVFLWVDQDNWMHDLKVEVLDELLREEKPIGSTHFSLLPYMKTRPEDAKEDTFDLFYTVKTNTGDERDTKEISCGEIVLRVKYFPAGKLNIVIEKAKNLRYPESQRPAHGDLSRIDPYASVSLDGQCATIVKRTPADKDGGVDPVWKAALDADIVDQYIMAVEVLHQNNQGNDILLGSVDMSLLQVFRNGQTSMWVTLKQKKANGGIREAGEIFVSLTFSGPIGIMFPQCRTDIDAFDDSVRKEVLTVLDSDVPLEEILKPMISTIPPTAKEIEDERYRLDKEKRRQDALDKKMSNYDTAEPSASSSSALVPRPPTAAGTSGEMESALMPPEFTEEEVIAAFKFIDLDRNNFIGAAEIRHILVCMGEMITDEEIDMMISMVDMDGDGQVSFQEFRTLVLHPNPDQINLHKEVSAAKDQEVMEEKQALAGKSVGLDLRAFQRQKELTAREKKKKVLMTFVTDNDVDFGYIKRSHENFLSFPKEKRRGGRIKFEEFCKALEIEPITEYKNIHSLFDSEELGDVDLREFLLSMMNFIEVEREIRIRFSFSMFDELKTGYITQKEVEEILKGNHMISLSSVQRKAETIMKQASANSAGAITMNEFVVISKKFPNILLPAIGNQGAAASRK